MVAINFQPQFVPAIEAGTKTQTVRRTARAKPGDTLQLYTGQRTKACRLIGTAKCLHVEPIRITDDAISVGASVSRSDIEHIARIDGFDSIELMISWFRDRYTLPFEGYRIFWGEFEPTATVLTKADLIAAKQHIMDNGRYWVLASDPTAPEHLLFVESCDTAEGAAAVAIELVKKPAIQKTAIRDSETGHLLAIGEEPKPLVDWALNYHGGEI